jgi:hypothetical protein
MSTIEYSNSRCQLAITGCLQQLCRLKDEKTNYFHAFLSYYETYQNAKTIAELASVCKSLETYLDFLVKQ